MLNCFPDQPFLPPCDYVTYNQTNTYHIVYNDSLIESAYGIEPFFELDFINDINFYELPLFQNTYHFFNRNDSNYIGSNFVETDFGVGKKVRPYLSNDSLLIPFYDAEFNISYANGFGVIHQLLYEWARYDFSLVGAIKQGDTLGHIYNYSSDLAIENHESNLKLAIYPNPVNDQINLPSEIRNIIVYSISGQLVLQEQNSNLKLDVSSLEKGIYIIRTFNEEGHEQLSKFIKN